MITHIFARWRRFGGTSLRHEGRGQPRSKPTILSSIDDGTLRVTVHAPAVGLSGSAPLVAFRRAKDDFGDL
jgi:hypothetical protein